MRGRRGREGKREGGVRQEGGRNGGRERGVEWKEGGRLLRRREPVKEGCVVSFKINRLRLNCPIGSSHQPST